MLKPSHLRTLAKTAADLGDPGLIELIAQVQAAHLARNRAEMRQLVFRIQADRATRHAEIRQLIAELAEAHARRRNELNELRAGVRAQLAEYAATNEEGREEWRRQLLAIERARRGLEAEETEFSS